MNPLSSQLKVLSKNKVSVKDSTLFVRHINDFQGINISQDAYNHHKPLIAYIEKRKVPNINSKIIIHDIKKPLNNTDKFVLSCATSLKEVTSVYLEGIQLQKEHFEQLLESVFPMTNKIEKVSFMDPRNDYEIKIFLGRISKLPSLVNYSIPKTKATGYRKEYENIFTQTKVIYDCVESKPWDHFLSKLNLTCSIWNNILHLQLKGRLGDSDRMSAILFDLARSAMNMSLSRLSVELCYIEDFEYFSQPLSDLIHSLPKIHHLEVYNICSALEPASYLMYPIMLENEYKLHTAIVTFMKLGEQQSYYLLRNRRISLQLGTSWKNEPISGYKVTIGRI
eukprot:snap_masked-scaffold_13-processed-gene-8.55-mRNA-1 protein AED:1.00 eAED:1.00 QI:0/-1/0/0/-1/1/1/0/336